MLRPRFFTTQALDSGTELVLEKEPSRHIARALRMRVGEQLCLFDGSGREAHGTIASIDRDAVTVQIRSLNEINRESRLTITLAIALSRGDRMDTVVQKGTELGVSEIWPLISERTGVRLDAERLEKKRAHWHKIAVSACEQCGRNIVPTIAAPASFDEIIQRAVPDDTLRLVLHPSIEPAALRESCDSLLLLIGPEGGFSDDEVNSAIAAGFQGLKLGPRVLRTETAPLAAIAVAQAHWGDYEF